MKNTPLLTALLPLALLHAHCKESEFRYTSHPMRVPATTWFPVEGATVDTTFVGRLSGWSEENRSPLSFFVGDDNSFGVDFPGPNEMFRLDSVVYDTAVVFLRRYYNTIGLDGKTTRIGTLFTDTVSKEGRWFIGYYGSWELCEIAIGDERYTPKQKAADNSERVVPLKITPDGRLALKLE